MSTCVAWTETRGAEKKTLSSICFARYPILQGSESVIYVADYSEVKKELVVGWLDLLSIMLEPSRYATTLGVSAEMGEKGNTYSLFYKKYTGVEFVLDVKGVPRPKVLLYLTAFRMPVEYPNFVSHYCALAEKCKTPEEKFAALLATEKANRKGDGHDLVYRGGAWVNGYVACTKDITLAEFKENLLNPSIKTVWDHFYPHEKPAATKP